MNSEIPEWLAAGKGCAPQFTWSFRANAPLECLSLARETGELFVGDASGDLYRLDRTGRTLSVTRGLSQLRALAWCDSGSAGAALVGDSQLVRLNRKMEADWSVNLLQTTLAVAIDPYGHHIAVSLAGGHTVILNRNKKRLCRFETIQPLKFLEFLITEPGLVGTAKQGHLCRHEVGGDEVWHERILATTGDLAVSGDGQAILLAAFNYGIQRYGYDGRSQTSYIIEGTVTRIGTSVGAKRIVAATFERHLYWLDPDGKPLWVTQTDEVVKHILCDPLGDWIVCGFESGQLMRLDWNHTRRKPVPKADC